MELVAPETADPFTFHWYAGVDPPLTGDAVNVTGVPAQTWLADGAMVTLTASRGLTTIAIATFDAGFPVVHVSLDVRKHFTLAPLRGTKV